MVVEETNKHLQLISHSFRGAIYYSDREAAGFTDTWVASILVEPHLQKECFNCGAIVDRADLQQYSRISSFISLVA